MTPPSAQIYRSVRELCERNYAAGDLSFDYASFVHTVLVDMRVRLRASKGTQSDLRRGSARTATGFAEGGWCISS
ncbi:MAG: hypothetical protein M3O46_00500, partial [Myxococcota bacterium]|nr:hypothetical protein [Myxococcota bacterium]